MNDLNENQKIPASQNNQPLSCPPTADPPQADPSAMGRPSAVEQENIKEQSPDLPQQTSKMSPDFSNSQPSIPPPYIPPFAASPSFDTPVSSPPFQPLAGDSQISPQPSVYSQPISQIQPSSKLEQQPPVSPQISQVPPTPSQHQPPRQTQFQTSVSSPYPSVPSSQPSISDISVRTAASDQESLKQSGGAETTAKFFSPTDLESVDLRTEVVFTAEGRPNPGEISDTQKSQRAFTQEPVSSNKKQKLLIVSLIVLSIIGIIAVFSFFLLPNLLKPSKTEPVNNILQEPLPFAPAVEEPKITLHNSYFLIKADKTDNFTLKNIELSSIKSAFSESVAVGKEVAEGISPELVEGTVKEIVFIEENGSIVPFPSLFSVVFPGIESHILNDLFEVDSTWFVYFDKKGAFPGLIAKVRPDKNKAVLDQFGKSFELLGNTLNNLFLNSVGSASKFNDGNIGGKPVRFASVVGIGPDAGKRFVFDYGWFQKGEENFLVVAASYQAMVEAVKRAGF